MLYTEPSCYLLMYALLIRRRCDAVAFCVAVSTEMTLVPLTHPFSHIFFSDLTFQFSVNLVQLCRPVCEMCNRLLTPCSLALTSDGPVAIN